MTLCSSTTTDRLSGCLAQCILPQGHDGDHTDGGGMTWGFRAHDLGIDQSATRVRQQLQVKPQPSPYSDPPPRTQCARCGLIEVCGEREDEPVCARCVWEMLDEARRERDELRDAARAVVRSEGAPVFVRHTAWRRLCALVTP